MLVPAMTLVEVRKEIDKDFPILFRKAEYVVAKLEKQHRPLKDKFVEQVFDYYSKYKNHWLYKVNITQHDRIVQFMVYFESKRGLSAVLLLNESKDLVYLTAHFFNRYNERLHLNLVKPYDILVSYLMDNMYYNRQRIETTAPGVNKIFCAGERGVSLGTELAALNVLRLNTFITHDMLKGDQVERFETMKKVLDKYSIHALVTEE